MCKPFGGGGESYRLPCTACLGTVSVVRGRDARLSKKRSDLGRGLARPAGRRDGRRSHEETEMGALEFEPFERVAGCTGPCHRSRNGSALVAETPLLFER